MEGRVAAAARLEQPGGARGAEREDRARPAGGKRHEER